MLAVEVTGCAAITGSDACVTRPDGAFRVFVASPADATFENDAGSVVARALGASDRGRLYEVHAPREARELRVVTHRSLDGASADAVARIALAVEEPWAWLTEAHARADRDDADGALSVYREHFTADDDDAEAGVAASEAARIELAKDHADAAAELFRRAIAKERAAGRLSRAVDDAMALAFVLAQRSHHTAEAVAALDGVHDLLDRYPDGRAREPYYRAVAVSEVGDRREALALFHRAEEDARRLGLSRLAQTVRSSLATELDLLGRFDDALEIRRGVERELGADAKPCDRVVARAGMGFGLLLIAVRAGGDRARVAEATRVLELARGETACTDVYLRAVTLGNLAYAALLDGRAADAASTLAEARALATDPPLSESFFWIDLDGRIALARGAPARALTIYDEMERRARAALLAEHAWSALVGRGAALEALSRPRDARSAYERAEDTLDDAELAIPIGEGRARFLVERGRSATAAIALEVASGDRDAAFRSARRARRRLLAGLEDARRLARRDAGQRARWDAAVDAYARERASIDEDAALDWKLPLAALGPAQARRAARELTLRAAIEKVLGLGGEDGGAPPAATDWSPGPGELALLYHPAIDGWTAMAADASGVSVFHVPPLDPHATPEETSRLLIAPAHERIARASRLRLLVSGALAPIDFHALPFDGAPLVARLAVEYGIDLAEVPPARSERASGSDGPLALVVGDPLRDLPQARRETHAVERALGRSGERVALLEGRAATHAAVTTALGTATFFHYAGHATYGGEDGWDSALPLAAGGRLLATDVLALHDAPARVVVSGCSAARTASAAPGETLGIAQAFLVAGSDAVVAPTRDVADALSVTFVEALYAELERDPRADLTTAVQRAQLQVREADPTSDWGNFRVLRR